MAEIIQIRRDTAANFTTANPILAQGETAYEIDTDKEKRGDGATAWNDLPYRIGSINYTPADEVDVIANTDAIAGHETRIAALEAAIDENIDHEYADIAAMIAGQNAQLEDDIIKVTDASGDDNVESGKAYYFYDIADTATPTGTIEDYTLLTSEEIKALTSQNIIDALGYTPANDSEVVKDVLDSEGVSVVTNGVAQLPEVTTKLENISALYEGSAGETIQVLGYYSNGDGGGGVFYWDATSIENDNGGTILSVSGVTTGRWKLTNTEITPYTFGLKGKDQEENLSYAQNYIDYCTENNLTALFKNDIFRIGDVQLTGSVHIRTENATLKNATNMVGDNIFSGVADGLKMSVKSDIDTNSKRLLQIDNSGVSAKVKGLELECEINDINGTGGRTRSVISLICALDSPVISVKGTSLNGNNAALVENNHSSYENNDIDLKNIELFGWGAGWIHEGTGYSEGVNRLRYFYAENAKGAAVNSIALILSVYHMRNMKLGELYSITSDAYAYLWTIDSFKLLYNKGYTGSNVSDDKKCAFLIESALGGGGNIVSLDSEFDGVRFRWGGYVEITHLRGERCKGYPLVAKHDLIGGAVLDVIIENMNCHSNEQGSILIERIDGAANVGVRRVNIKGGISRDNNQLTASPDIKMILGQDVIVNVSDLISSGSDCAVDISGDGGYQHISICNNPYLSSTGTETVKITGTATGGWREIRNNTVDDTTKLNISGSNIAKIIQNNFDRNLLKVVPEYEDKGYSAIFGLGTGVEEQGAVTTDILNFNRTQFRRVVASAPNNPSGVNGFYSTIYRSATSKTIYFIDDNNSVFTNTMNSGAWTGWKKLIGESDVADAFEVGARNRFIEKNTTPEVLSSNGTLTSDPSYKTSDFIEVVEGKTYTLNKNTGANFHRIGLYDINKVFISRILSADQIYKYTAESGVAFIRESTTATFDVKVEKGDKATDYTEAPEDVFSQVQEIARAKEATGTALDLSKVSGTNYNYASASSATTYTTANPVINGYAKGLINAASEPTVTGATKISGATFTANTNMELVVESVDGTNVRYFFLEL